MAPGGEMFRYPQPFGDNVLPHGSHEWLPYSVIPTLLKTDLQTTIYRFAKSSRYMVIIVPGCVDVKAEIVNRDFS